MPAKRHVVTLTPAERDHLDALTRAGMRSARTITRARILLLTDQGGGGLGWEDRRVDEALGCGQGSSAEPAAAPDPAPQPGR
jgi:hypothetical protein